ncbi:phage tail tape measure protein [Bacteroides sp. 51]|nr:phage tail tape measure protein [Bacteroides sp. 51]
MASSVASQIVDYKRLQTAYNDLGNDMNKKKKFIQDNQGEFDKLGVSVNSILDAENLFVGNEQAFIKSLTNRALAAAAMKMAEGDYTKAIQKMMDAENYVASEDDIKDAKFVADNWLQKGGLKKGQRLIDVYEPIATEKGQYNTEPGIQKQRAQYNAVKETNLQQITEQSRERLVAEAYDFYEEVGKKTAAAAKLMKKSDDELVAASINKKEDKKTSTNYDPNAAKKRAQEMKRVDKELDFEVEKARIASLEEGEGKILAAINLNNEREIEAIKRKRDDAIKAEKETFEKNRDNEGQIYDSSDTEDKYNKIIKYTEDKHARDEGKREEEAQKVKLESMRNYLKEYGNFQQQKLAIAEEYAEKIKKAEAEGNTGEAMRLKKKEQSATAAVDIAAIKANVDWEMVFGEFGNMFQDVVKSKLDQAEKYTETEEFKNADPGTQKELTGLIDQMKKTLGGTGGVSFKKLGEEVKIYQNSLYSLAFATDVNTEAQNKLKKANEDYNKALKEGTEEEKKSAKEAVDTAKLNASAATESVKAQTDATKQNERNVSSTAANLKKNMDNVTEGMSKLASGGLANAYSGLIQMGKGMGGTMEKVADSLGDVPIVGWIVSIIDVLKDGLSNLVGGLLDAIFNAVAGIIDDIVSGDLFVTIGKSLMTGLTKIFDAISFGGFSSLVDSIHGGNAKESAEKIAELTASNDALKTSIDGLKDKIAGTNGTKSINAYNEIITAQGKYEGNLQQILDTQMRYSNAHSSNAKYWDLNKSSLSDVNKLLGTNLKNSWSDFSKLTADQMNDIRTYLPEVWSEMINQGKYGDRFKDDWNNYADQAGEVEQMTTQLHESLTQISFDSLRDSFVNALMDMNSNAEDFADNFKEYMTKALLNFAVGDKLDQKMKGWYESWAKTMNEQKGNLTKEQINNFRTEWDEFVQEGINERNAITELTGYTGKSDSSTSQESTKRGFETMSQDTGEELNGRFTALQIAGEETRVQSILQTEILARAESQLEALLIAESQHINIADETREIIVNSYLELQSIRENTGAIVKPINNMSEKLDTIERKIQTL